jgi:hypothetical protein
MSRLPEFRRVSGNGLEKAKWMLGDGAEPNRRGVRLRGEVRPPSFQPLEVTHDLPTGKA